MSLIEVRLRPAGPWRVGHRAGDRERVDVIYHSDALYSAVTHAMKSLGWLEEWLEATARAAGNPVARFSSLFPFIGKTRLITPPRTSWPPANPGKLYLQGSKLVPLELVRGGTFDESRWSADGASECLVPAGAEAPFHVSMRSAAAVDRITGATEPHRVACLEFAPNAGWWGVFEATDKTWEARVKSALRLLADSGFGGERSRGWGRAGSPQFSDASNLFGGGEANGTWWLLSLYSPGAADVIDWSRGEYSTATRGGWTDSPSGAGPKKQVRMIEEGSVLSGGELRGRAVDVAPDGFAHPVYRSGFALAVPLPNVGQALPPVPEAGEEPAAVIPEDIPLADASDSETPIPSRDREEAVVAAVQEEPAAFATEEPAPSPAEEHAASLPEEPAAPAAEEPAASAPEEPAVTAAEEPAASAPEEASAPVVEEPAASASEPPAADSENPATPERGEVEE